MHHEPFAVIDLGSNSIRFVIYVQDSTGRMKETENVKVSARLSTHTDEIGNITRNGVKVVIECLHRFRLLASSYRMKHIIGVATAAIRQAPNQQSVLKEIYSETGLSFNVLSEHEEAYYGYLAVVNSTDVQNGITIDIGGGSTEVTLFENRKLRHTHSFPFGAITLSKLFIQHDPMTSDELNELDTFLEQSFSNLPWLIHHGYPLIGIGGSARNMSLIHQRYINYPLAGIHHYEMEYEDVRSTFERLSILPLSKRQQVDGLSKERADIIVPAVYVIQKFMQISAANRFILSRKGLRDGIFFERMLQPFQIRYLPNVAENSYQQLMNEFHIELNNVQQITRIVHQLFHIIQESGECELDDGDWRLLRQAARVMYIGEFIDSESSSAHTFYVLSNRTIDGVDHLTRLKVALIASYTSKAVFNEYVQPYKHWLSKKERHQLQCLGAILKLSYGLDITKRSVVQSVHRRDTSDQTLSITVVVHGESYFEEQYVQRHKKQLEKRLKCCMDIEFTRH